ncbi:uncharacterized protein LOC129837572 [Salvelinus fontinalis]|uniref:uncharacterized protein LOC129837572 n=1 Tax=Salvelinus fontinalis TaxID=8038 RepID=UPI002486BA69|nr:uncharacterized protein LOC129837572 [Salvelinus fontinalis]
MGAVREPQKKLRQIEHLEIHISQSFPPEERVKAQNTTSLLIFIRSFNISRAISRKAELRTRLAELLLQLSGPQQTPGIVGEGKHEEMKNEATSEALPSHSPSPTKIPKGEAGPTEEDRQSEGDDAEFTSLKASWERAKFRLRSMEGHSDIITCVVTVDNLVISLSRDKTVKLWPVPTATEQWNLGGHTGGVTCLSAPPPEYCRRLAKDMSPGDKERFLLSGSADCCVRNWALSTGQCVKSIYTFNLVTALCFVPEGDGYIITGSGRELDNCQSINANEEAVTSLQSQGPLVFSSSAEGGVSVWEGLCTNRDPLQLLHPWDATVTGCGSQGGRLALCPRGDRLSIAYGRANLGILNWRIGTVSRLTNHSSFARVTDCVHQTLLIGSCYDLADGESTLNLFSLPLCQYLASPTCADAQRIVCFAALLTGRGGHRWVTGGRALTVWEQLPSSGKHLSVGTHLDE